MPLDPPVTTTRDGRGVWFIEGGSLYDAFEAMGRGEGAGSGFGIHQTWRTRATETTLELAQRFDGDCHPGAVVQRFCDQP